MKIVVLLLFISLGSVGWAGSLHSHLWRATKGSHEVSLLGTHHGVRLGQVHPRVVLYALYAEAFLVELDQSSFEFKAALKNFIDLKNRSYFSTADWLRVRSHLVHGKNFWRRLVVRIQMRLSSPSELYSRLLLARSKALGIKIESQSNFIDREIPAWIAKPVFSLDNYEMRQSLYDPIIVREAGQIAAFTDEQAREYFEEKMRETAQLKSDYLAGIWTSLKKSLRESPENLANASAMNQRNHAWIDKVLRSPTRSLVVVGAAHLMGRDGLLALLKKQGYRVERVRTETDVYDCISALKQEPAVVDVAPNTIR